MPIPEALLRLFGPTLAVVIGIGTGLLVGALNYARIAGVSPRQALRMIVERLLDRLRPK